MTLSATGGQGERGRLERAAPWLSTAARLVLGGVLLAAGGLKVIDPQSSVEAVQAYELLTPGSARIVGWGLPFVELAVGLLLVIGLLTRAAAVVAAVMLAVFTAAVISVAVRGLSIDCGCFGGGGQVAAGTTTYGVEIARDVFLLLLAGWLIWRPRSRFAIVHEESGEHE